MRNPLKIYKIKFKGHTLWVGKRDRGEVEGETEVKATNKKAAISLAKLMYPTIDFEAIEAYLEEKKNNETRK